ncbi:cupin domain-containing protein [Candidatus Gottesmanbacteria bacterium]|nr:cupin domain-containing protein [Candidatus Gottesmanbacteria bacterium]
MKIIFNKKLKYSPASHENPLHRVAFKKIIFTQKDIMKDGKIQMINWAKLIKGKSFVPHYHEDMEEIFIIIKGRATITVDKEKKDLNSGDSVLIPPKAIHEMKNISYSDVEYLVIGITLGIGGKTIVTKKL